ncbi:MAG: hypothetical protein IPM51_10000 [Sphingobacteriaceae bacterium]|nr:hypothetical protein [Sphingobacteriaceae bacterium]
MKEEGKTRIPRSPKSPEEVANLHLYKKLKEYKKVASFKRTRFYKVCNIFNVISFFIYVELVFCFFGPCHYQNHYSKNVKAEYGNTEKGNGDLLVNVFITSVNEKSYEFVVKEKIKPPPKFSKFYVGKDFILQKELKGGFEGGSRNYRIYTSGGVVFLSCFVGVFSLILFSYNMNMHLHSLRAITIINALTILGFVIF